MASVALSAERERRTENVFHMLLRGGSTRLKITWVQQRQYHRAHGSARERVLSLALKWERMDQGKKGGTQGLTQR